MYEVYFQINDRFWNRIKFKINCGNFQLSRVTIFQCRVEFRVPIFDNFLMKFKSGSFHMQRCCEKSSEMAKNEEKMCVSHLI